MPEDDLRSAMATLKADELVTDEACVYLVMNMVGCVGKGGGGGWYACGTKPRELVACREILEHLLSAR